MQTKPKGALVLYQFRPAYDIIAYLVFAGVPLSECRVENIDYPVLKACDEEPLPCMRQGNQFIPRSDVFEFLKREYADLNAGLSLETKAESLALISLLRADLAQCIDAVRYGDDEHWKKITYPQLVQALPFPFGRLEARKIRRDAMAGLRHLSPRQALSRVKLAYSALSNKLGENKWILNTPGPSTVDAFLFGHMCQAKFEPGFCDLLKDEELANLEVHFLQSLNRVRQSRFFATSKLLPFPGPDVELVICPIPAAFTRKAEVKEEERSLLSSKDWAGLGGVFVYTLVVVTLFLRFNNMEPIVANFQEYDEGEEND